MLKWAVNGPRQTYLQSNEHLNHNIPSAEQTRLTQVQRRRLKRKSSDVGSLRPRTSWHDKENQYTSTPLHPTSRSFNESPSRKLDSLKDLSNIVAEPLAFNSPKRLSLAKTPPSLLKTPEPCSAAKSNMPTNYASTLPTFDVEYSPCALIPGPLLALRGVGIPDSYFEKPRYITPHPHPQDSPNSNEETLETKSFVKPKELTIRYPTSMEESSLSSSKMGDVTLERMIDAILESTRKDRRQQKAHKHHGNGHHNMSPSYTPAEDPASDLHEVWDSEKARYRQKEQEFRAKLTKKSLFNEREVCSPRLSQEEIDAGQLRRQGGVRRKRKLNQIKASVISSAQKLLGKSAHQQTPLLHSYNLRNVFEAELIQDEVHPQKLMRNVSPDSGHNSSSEYEEEDNDSTLACQTTTTLEDTKTLDATKRRLSFSLTKLSDS
ncbi:uncharacterized protein LOC106083078 [Stomoxys calcitrans]|uniref:Uncharacterized protein n=1 Tax=Stomoxys calcitrans TaxID=35570 RepID=A0A1I8PE39_STOCA|nr:uncharacterized protein LOC106083078 [Stomoxys calcitrans]XP_013101379.1 unnamed protein product [Stomoxys calcitrans]